jgi:sulfur carrier protein
VRVEVNGKAQELPEGATVAALLELLGVGGARVAVEHNRCIVPRTQHGAIRLAEDDQLEVVTFVGGG